MQIASYFVYIHIVYLVAHETVAMTSSEIHQSIVGIIWMITQVP